MTKRLQPMTRATWLLLHRTLLTAFLWNSSIMDTAKIMVAPHKDNAAIQQQQQQQQQAEANNPPPSASASSPPGSLLFLVGNATGLLADNYRAGGMGATIPSPLVDEHQHSTTSLMVAHAWAHIDQHRARAEMLSVFRGQWENGMVPTVRYAPGYVDDYLGGSIIPGPGGWGNASATSAEGANTSALAATPLHAEVALRIFDLSPRDVEARLWLQGLFPALFRYHDYLHRSREDPETGLVYVYHPWETEVAPDSVLWPALLEDTSERAANESWSPPPIPSTVSSVVGFPGEEAFEASLFLADCAARVGRIDQDVQRECPFLLQDVQFNAALVRSDRALLELAGILEATRSGWQSKVYTPEQFERITKWAARAESGTAMEHFWSPSDGAFLSRYTSAVTAEVFLVRPSTSSSFSALLAPGLVPFRSSSAVNLLLSPGELSFRCENYPIPEVECGFAGSDGEIIVVDGGGGGIGSDGGGSGGGGGGGGGGIGELGGVLSAAGGEGAAPAASAAVRLDAEGEEVTERAGPEEEGAAAAAAAAAVVTTATSLSEASEGATAAAAAAARFDAVREEVTEKAGLEEEVAAAAAVVTTATTERRRRKRSRTLIRKVGWGASASAAEQEDADPTVSVRESDAWREGEGGTVGGGGRGYERSRQPCSATGGACLTEREPPAPPSGQPAAGEGGAVRRVWVLHNILAARGLGQQALLGVSVWLANSTLSLIAPDHPPVDADDLSTFAEGEKVVGRDNDNDNNDNGNPRRSGVGTEDERFRRLGGADVGNGSSSSSSWFRFHRAFDASSGLPLPDAEGNASSIAAATSVLLLLGDGPHGGNNFPPITHATLFVLMAIELGFSFIMGVTCLVFSISLVRKLQEDDHPPRGYTGGRGNGGRGNGSGGTSAGSANAQPSRRRDGTLGGGGGGGGGLRVGVVRGKNDEDQRRRSGSPTGLGYGGRGIGSLLRRNAGSRVDLYEDSDDDDYAEAMTVGGGGRLDAAWTHGESQDSDDEDSGRGRDSSGGGGGGEGGGGGGGLRDGRHFYHTLPADNTNNGNDDGGTIGGAPSREDDYRKGNASTTITAMPAAAAAAAASPFRWAEDGGGGAGEEMLQEIPPRLGSGAAGRGGEGGGGGVDADFFSQSAALNTDRGNDNDDNGGGGGRGGGDSSDHGDDAGFLDVLRPFYSSMKFW